MHFERQQYIEDGERNRLDEAWFRCSIFSPRRVGDRFTADAEDDEARLDSPTTTAVLNAARMYE